MLVWISHFDTQSPDPVAGCHVVHLANDLAAVRVCDSITELQQSAEKYWTNWQEDWCFRLAKEFIITVSHGATNLSCKKVHRCKKRG